RRHTRSKRDWSSDVCSSDLQESDAVTGRMSPAPLPASRWQFDPASWPSSDLVAIGADLEPATLVAAYSAGVFPMRVDGHLGWWSPMTRGVLKPDELHVSRSLRKSAKRFQISVDTAFDDVIAACAA